MSNLMRICLRRSFCTQSKEKILEGLKVKQYWLVPSTPVPSKIDKSKLPARTKIDANTIALLERLSLVDCANKQGIETLEEAIAFADQILQINTAYIEPLITVLEDNPLTLREDTITAGGNRDKILVNAALTEEEYFLAPPGNIPLEARADPLFEEK